MIPNQLFKLNFVLNIMKILITGASGMVGSALNKKLYSLGHEVLTLSSGNVSKKNSFRWSIDKGILDPLPINDIDAVIHLSGAGIAAEKWTEKRKVELIKSRTMAVHYLFEAFKKENKFPTYFISAGGVGIYQVNKPDALSENAPHDNSFLAQICKEWEQAAQLFNPFSKVIVMRMGVVLGNNGFLKEILKPARFYFGAILGNGKQIVPWVQLNDVVNAFVFALQGNLKPDTYNLVAPAKDNLKLITKTAVKFIRKPQPLPSIPAFIIKLLFGERSVLLLSSQIVSSQKLIDQGFIFEETQLSSAINTSLKNA